MAARYWHVLLHPQLPDGAGTLRCQQVAQHASPLVPCGGLAQNARKEAAVLVLE